jgi:hypothetical protein
MHGAGISLHLPVLQQVLYFLNAQQTLWEGILSTVSRYPGITAMYKTLSTSKGAEQISSLWYSLA